MWLSKQAGESLVISPSNPFFFFFVCDFVNQKDGNTTFFLCQGFALLSFKL